MNREYFFKTAKWVGAPNRTEQTFSIIRGRFSVDAATGVSLNVLGLGFFLCYINGICINPDTFLPLSSEYEKSNEPVGESLSGHRVYVPTFDITPFVKKGENVIAIHFGGGWYMNSARVMGLPKAIYCVEVKEESETKYFVSDESCKVCKSFVYDYELVSTERHNLNDFVKCTDEDFDDSGCGNAIITEQLATEYCVTDCPWDKLAAELGVRKIGYGAKGVVYDCGRNLTGYPV